MEAGRQTVCPKCLAVHTFGARLGVKPQSARFCSLACELGWAESPKWRPMTDGEKRNVAEWLSQKGELDRMTRAVELKTIYCNRCVTSMRWSPALDGSDCPDCGYTLSLYGPFETLPSLDTNPTPLAPKWDAHLPVTRPPDFPPAHA